MTTKELIEEEFDSIAGVLARFTSEPKNIEAIEDAANTMIRCIKNGGKIIACGNGGSMSDAMHFASELTGRYRGNREPIAAIAISDPGHLSCVGNDYGYNQIFRRFLLAHAKENDVLLALSTSGDSSNIAHAMNTAYSRLKIKSILITGSDGGEIGESMDFHKDSTLLQMINIPHSGTADRVQEITIMILHILVMLIEKGVEDEWT